MDYLQHDIICWMFFFVFLILFMERKFPKQGGVFKNTMNFESGFNLRKHFFLMTGNIYGNKHLPVAGS